MHIKGFVHEDFIQYKKPSMFIATSTCSFKCDKECGMPVCQNSALANSPTHNIRDNVLIASYRDNRITKSIVIGGLEPFDTWDEVRTFIVKVRASGIKDDIVIYTGYTEEEVSDKISELSKMENLTDIIVKFGRYIPNSNSRHDEVLGVTLASDNQYAKRIC